MKQFMAFTKKEFLEQLRTGKFFYSYNDFLSVRHYESCHSQNNTMAYGTDVRTAC